MKFNTVLSRTALIAVFACSLSFGAQAQDFHHHNFHDYHDHDFHEFHYDHWRGGRWINAFHDGRAGWWWIVDGVWYSYPAPIYPYPDPYAPPAVVVEAAPAGMQAYYYCASPAGYYPSVPACATAWQRVLQPAQAPAQVVVMPPPPATVIAPAPVPQVNQREIDLQKVNEYAAILQSINPADPTARARLKDLSKKADALRRVVAKRDYNPISMLSNIDDLKKHIAEKRRFLSAPQPPVVMAPAPVPGTVAPGTPLPPGTPVTFPPQ